MRNPNGTTVRGQAAEVCGAKRKVREGEDPAGEYRCMLAAGFGTPHLGRGHCKYHLGNSPAHLTQLATEDAHEAVRTFGLPTDISPTEALLAEVNRTAGAVAYLEGVVAGLAEDQLKQVDTTGGGGRKTVPSVWVTMYQAERGHLVRVAAEAIKCGVAERQVQIAEQQGLLLAGALRSILTRLGVLNHPDAPQVVREELLRLSSVAVSSSIRPTGTSTNTRELSQAS